MKPHSASMRHTLFATKWLGRPCSGQLHLKRWTRVAPSGRSQSKITAPSLDQCQNSRKGAKFAKVLSKERTRGEETRAGTNLVPVFSLAFFFLSENLCVLCAFARGFLLLVGFKWPVGFRCDSTDLQLKKVPEETTSDQGSI